MQDNQQPMSGISVNISIDTATVEALAEIAKTAKALHDQVEGLRVILMTKSS